MHRIKDRWMRLTLYRKIAIFVLGVISVMILSVGFTMQIMNASLKKFHDILMDNSVCYTLYEVLEYEKKAFGNYILSHTEEDASLFYSACQKTQDQLSLLPAEYGKIGEERYARTWNIMNGYEGYSVYRDEVAEMGQNEPEYVTKLYRVYEMQESLLNYALRLQQETLKEGNREYLQRERMFRYIPFVIAAAAGIMSVVLILLSRLFAKTLIFPLVSMSRNFRRIAENDFDVEELFVENEDELGELVNAFNYMAKTTHNYIRVLEEKNQMEELLYKEELEKLEIVKQRNAAQLELLKSQVNPHFLFNTLSMVAGMARLEEAEVTEKMISSLSSLLRYSLRTKSQIVFLEQELQVIENYMYIQQMRFEPRIQYRLILQADKERAQLPAFTLQPLVENAIIHGIAKKEEGGRVILHIWEKDFKIFITVADNGKGMSPGRYREVSDALRRGDTQGKGIGLGNISLRVKRLYQNGSCKIYSREHVGTVVKLEIPQIMPEDREGNGEKEGNV